MKLIKETLTPFEIMIFEKYFSGDESISIDECYFYFQMLRQTKDFSDSKHTLNDGDCTKFEMVFMNLGKDGDNITFNGAVSNGVENRCVNGVIKQKGKRYYVLSQVYRMHELVLEDIKEYYVYDTFKRIKDRLYQETIYDESLSYRKSHDDEYVFKRKIEEFDMESFAEFRTMVGKTYSL